MAGDLRATNLVDDGSGANIPLATLAETMGKSWANLNGTGTIALRDSFGVSSATDNGTGDYSFNWTTAFSGANYGCVDGNWNSVTSRELCVSLSSAVTMSTASAIRRGCAGSTGGAATDVLALMIFAFGQ